MVQLTDQANGNLNADAIRIERVEPAPEIEVLVQDANVADGSGVVDFGATLVGLPVSRTFTVRNRGPESLTLSGPISVPSGFTLVSSFGATTLASEQSTTFTIRLNSGALGNFGGQVSFNNNDPDEGPFNFTVQGAVEEPATVQIIDNGNAAFGAVGQWTQWQGQGFENDIHESLPGTGADVATWTFSNCCPDVIKWRRPGQPTRTGPLMHRSEMLDGTTSRVTAAVNQRVAPNDFSDAGAAREVIGASVRVDNGTLVVRLSDAANGRLNADAIRVEKLADAPEIEVSAGGVNLVDGTSTFDFGNTPPGTPVTRTFTVENTGTQTLVFDRPSRALRIQPWSRVSPTPRLQPDQSTTFTVRFNATAAAPPQVLSPLAAMTRTKTRSTSPSPLRPRSRRRCRSSIMAIPDSTRSVSGLNGEARGSRATPRESTRNRFRRRDLDVLGAAARRVPCGRHVDQLQQPGHQRAVHDPERHHAAVHRASQPAAGPQRILGRRSILAVPGHGLRDHRQYAGGETERCRQRATQRRCDPYWKRLCPRFRSSQGSQTLVDGQSVVQFGSTELGTPKSMTFTVTNLGGKDLHLSEPITVPQGFSLVSGFGATTLSLGQSTTFVVQMDATELGTPSGTVVFGNDDADENPFSFTVQGTVVAEAVLEIIDNGDVGFSAVGEWSRWTGQGFENDVDESLPGIGADAVSWTFTDLPAGEYRVSATWTAFSNRASEAPFTIFDNTTSLATIEVNQQLAPSQFSDAGVNWHDLGGTYLIDSGTLVVRLTDAPSGRVNADAIRVERVESGGIASLGEGEFVFVRAGGRAAGDR